MSNHVISIKVHDMKYRDEATILLFETQFSEPARQAVEYIKKWMEDYKETEDKLYREEINGSHMEEDRRRAVLGAMMDVLGTKYPIPHSKIERMTDIEWAGYVVNMEEIEEYV